MRPRRLTDRIYQRLTVNKMVSTAGFFSFGGSIHGLSHSQRLVTLPTCFRFKAHRRLYVPDPSTLFFSFTFVWSAHHSSSWPVWIGEIWYALLCASSSKATPFGSGPDRRACAAIPTASGSALVVTILGLLRFFPFTCFNSTIDASPATD